MTSSVSPPILFLSTVAVIVTPTSASLDDARDTTATKTATIMMFSIVLTVLIGGLMVILHHTKAIIANLRRLDSTTTTTTTTSTLLTPQTKTISTTTLSPSSTIIIPTTTTTTTTTSLLRRRDSSSPTTKYLSMVLCDGVVPGSDSLSFDTLALARRLLEESPLTTVVQAVGGSLFKSHGLVSAFAFDEETLSRFLHHLGCGYNDRNPYHNATHAADVSQAVSVAVNALESTQFRLTELEVLSLLLAALAHDYRHPGVNNSFLVNTSDPIALRYNGLSVLENFHASESLTLLRCRKDLNFLTGRLNQQQCTTVFSTVVQLILATDMARHREFLQHFTDRNTAGMLDPTAPADRLLVMQMILKWADISNCTRPWTISRQWALLVQEEFWQQGDREKELDMPVLPAMDRSLPFSLEKSQCGFIENVVLPLTNMLLQVIPIPDAFENLQTNLRRYQQLQQQQQQQQS